ncbi:MAG: sulfate adenylyltransferase, partial [Acidimicrobiia bacterium]|nr:sulfate adenylyltransferase [Acidimicrobiia bacterium]
SRQVPLEQIPRVQKAIIQSAKSMGTKVYVATNLMESMVTLPNPTRAEVNDVYNTLGDGADGLVLAAETAVGRYPVGCASMLVRIAREFHSAADRDAMLPSTPISLLVEPLGGSLTLIETPRPTPESLEAMPILEVGETDLMDCELMANGTYSPLTGFMGKDALESVLHDHRLPSGLPWTMPILLSVDADASARLGTGDLVHLKAPDSGAFAVLEVEEVFTYDGEELAERWFGTTSVEHPGVKRLARRGTTFLSGQVKYAEPAESSLEQYKLAPAMARFIFAKKGWSQVVGFHSRNAPHRVHEFLQLEALKRTHADGLFISPVIGPQKPGDYYPGPILKSYQRLLDFGHYPRGKVVLGCFPTYPRYCGPREAVFTAICRQNMGCSHFIVGRDHAGVGNFYRDRATRDLFDQVEDLDVRPVFFDKVGYHQASASYRSNGAGELVTISGSKARQALRDQEELPEWYMRDVVQEVLRLDLARGEQIFRE